jgi:hypothetical protein
LVWIFIQTGDVGTSPDQPAPFHFNVLTGKNPLPEEVMSACPDVGWRAPPGDVEALRVALQSCIDDRESVMKARECAVVAASSQWAWESFDRKMAELLGKAASDDETSTPLKSIS